MSALVLTRKVNERVRLRQKNGEDVWITITSVDRNQVKLKFDASKNVQIDREERVCN